jgi:hypothetical protein
MGSFVLGIPRLSLIVFTVKMKTNKKALEEHFLISDFKYRKREENVEST